MPWVRTCVRGLLTSGVLLMLCGSTVCGSSALAQDAGADGLDLLTISGRSERTDGGLRFDWPGVELTVRVKGRAVDATFSTLDGGALLAVESDETPLRMVELTGGSQTVHLATFKNARAHTLTIRKATEANYSGPVDLTQVWAPGGALVPAHRTYRHRLEWLGDSLSTGFGIMSRHQHKCPNDFRLQDFTLATPALVARRFDADLHAVVAGGWGLTKGWVVPHEQYQFHKLYTRRLYSDPVEGTFELDDFKPEAVVVSLGSNDVSMKVTQEDARDALVALLTTVRQHRPGVPILLVSTNTTTDFIAAAAEAFHDEHLKVIALDFLKEEGFACWHPTRVTSQRWADELALALHEVAGW